MLTLKQYLIYLAVLALSYGMWNLVLQPGIKPGPPASGAQAREPLDHQGRPQCQCLIAHAVLGSCLFYCHLVAQLFRLFETPHQASLSFTISWSVLKLMSLESVMPSNYLVLRRPLLFLHSIFPSIGVFSILEILHKNCQIEQDSPFFPSYFLLCFVLVL